MRRIVLGMFVGLSFLLAISVGVHGQSGKNKAAVPLEKTEWELVWLSNTKIEPAGPQQMPYIQLDPESHRVSGSGGCNRLMGTYQLEGNSLKFTQMAITRMACIHGGNTEDNFVKALDQVTSWKMANGKLLLMDADQHVLAKFSGVTPES